VTTHDTPEASRHEVGDPHQYQIVCLVCGQWGVLRLSVDPQTVVPIPLHEQGDGQATYVPYSSEYEATRSVRIRMKLRDVVKHVWTPRLARQEAEKHVALGSWWLSMDFDVTEGRVVESAAIVIWRGN
jgi:hypothetical protein